MTDQTQRIQWIARIFYQLKTGRQRTITRRDKVWMHFERTLTWITAIGALKNWKVYLAAQFHYGKDKAGMWPTMLYNAGATQKYKWYLNKKKRRMGHIRPRELQYERSLDKIRLQSYFTQGAWTLEAHVRRGMKEIIVLRLFTASFHPLFVIANEDAWGLLCEGYKGFGPEVLRRYERIAGYSSARLDQTLTRLRRLYHDAREGQRRTWDSYRPAVGHSPEEDV